MKTFFASAGIFLAVCGFVIWNMLSINSVIGKMNDIWEKLPQSLDEFDANYGDAMINSEKLSRLWDEKIDRLAYTVGYENIDRADDAMTELYTSAKNHDGEDFITAAMKFYDALRRLRELEGIDFQSIM